jgi:hypothetical protein
VPIICHAKRWFVPVTELFCVTKALYHRLLSLSGLSLSPTVLSNPCKWGDTVWVCIPYCAYTWSEVCQWTGSGLEESSQSLKLVLNGAPVLDGRVPFDVAPGTSNLRRILYFDQMSWLPITCSSVAIA